MQLGDPLYENLYMIYYIQKLHYKEKYMLRELQIRYKGDSKLKGMGLTGSQRKQSNSKSLKIMQTLEKLTTAYLFEYINR